MSEAALRVVADTPVAVIEEEHEPRQLSDVAKRWRAKMKKARVKGVCSLKGCTKKSYAPRGLWCEPHKRQLTLEQNLEASKRHYWRKKNGEPLPRAGLKKRRGRRSVR